MLTMDCVPQSVKGKRKVTASLRRNPHIIHVQRWGCGIPRNCYVEPILAAGKMVFSHWIILFFCICRKHTDDDDDDAKARFNIWIFLSLYWENTTFSIPLTGNMY